MSIFFLQKLEEFKIDVPENTYLICHEMYTPAKITGVEIIPFQKWRLEYSNYHPELLIVQGINRMITPSNRCDFINEYMQTLTPNVKKISIDSAPFIGEPWRLWFHYSIANCGNFNINYSYAIETEWKKWFYREVNTCRLDGDNIQLFINSTHSDLPLLNTSFSFYEVDDEKYNEIKRFIFNKYNSPKQIINNILKETNKAYGIDLKITDYDLNQLIKLPDLKIYRFISEELSRRMRIYNKVVTYETL